MFLILFTRNIFIIIFLLLCILERNLTNTELQENEERKFSKKVKIGMYSGGYLFILKKLIF